MGFRDVFSGKALLRVEERYRSGFLRMIFFEGIPAKISEKGEGEGIFAEVAPKFVKKIALLLDKYSIKVYIINIKGFCTLPSLLRRRMGAVLGTVIFFAFLWISTLFLWRVEIVGAERLDEDILRGTLSSLGVDAGTVISRLDAFEVSNALLVSCPELSWASLSVKGTTATLTVRETVEHEATPQNGTPLLVASEGGVVQSVLVYSGAAAVKVGSVVKAGDVLINGIISDSGLQYTDAPVLRLEDAEGSVTALVERTFSVFVPYSESYSEVLSGGREFRGKRIRIFGGGFYVGDRGPADGEYAVSESKKQITVFGAVLPFTVSETVWNELCVQVSERSAEDAESYARECMDTRMRDDLGGAELISAEYTVSHGDDGCTVTVVYKCITEIAVSADIVSDGS